MYFSTRSIEKSDRKNAWLEAWGSVCGEFDVDFGTGNFVGEIDSRNVGGLEAVRLLQTSRGASRTESMKPSVDMGYFLILQCAGRSSLTCGNQEAVLVPGESALVDSLMSIHSRYSGKNIAISYHIPRDEIESRLGGHPRSGILLPKRGGQNFLHSVLSSAFESGPLISQEASGSFRNFLFELLADCIRDDAEGDLYAPKFEAQLHGKIKEFALNNLRNEYLSPTFIASEFNVSERQVHRVFEAEGVSISRWIKKARMHRCAHALRQSCDSSRSITDIAFDLGFRDLPHFSRSFREEFGVSASGYRLQCASELEASNP